MEGDFWTIIEIIIVKNMVKVTNYCFDSIIDHFTANNTELLLLTNSKDSKYGYDMHVNTPDIPLGATKHPDRVGHPIMAHRIYESNQIDKIPL